MPELAAHLERAKELAEQIDLIEYGPEHRGFFETEEVTKLLAAALAACAREARYQEANAAYWAWKLSHEDFGANQQKRLDELRKEG